VGEKISIITAKAKPLDTGLRASSMAMISRLSISDLPGILTPAYQKCKV
jgi:hypothetical protein